MPYYVIGPDGQKYGPAEPQQLQAWAAEGRITPQTFIEDATSGARVPAGALPYLTNPNPAAIPAPPPATQAFPPPIAGAALPAANVQAALSTGAAKPITRRRRPLTAVVRIIGALFIISVFVKRIAAGHPVMTHTGSHGYFNVWLDKYPAIDLVIAALLVFWAWQAWTGRE